jgi:hypothetical protein
LKCTSLYIVMLPRKEIEERYVIFWNLFIYLFIYLLLMNLICMKGSSFKFIFFLLEHVISTSDADRKRGIYNLKRLRFLIKIARKSSNVIVVHVYVNK